jgi:hypothetical protein
VPYHYRHHLFSHRDNPNDGRLPSLSVYAISRTLSRLQLVVDHSRDRPVHRSKANSPHSTGHKSATSSHKLKSRSLNGTSSATPSHSPQLKSETRDLQLPGFRHLTLGRTPLLSPLEPQTGGFYLRLPPPQSREPSISDIVTGNTQKLPLPRVPTISVPDKLNPYHWA